MKLGEVVVPIVLQFHQVSSDEKQKSFINCPFFFSEFQSVSRTVKIVHSATVHIPIWIPPRGKIGLYCVICIVSTILLFFGALSALGSSNFDRNIKREMQFFSWWVFKYCSGKYPLHLSRWTALSQDWRDIWNESKWKPPVNNDKHCSASSLI